MTRGGGLFNKNVAPREAERLRTGGEACPVPVSETRFQPGQGRVNGGGNPDSLKVA